VVAAGLEEEEEDEEEEDEGPDDSGPTEEDEDVEGEDAQKARVDPEAGENLGSRQTGQSWQLRRLGRASAKLVA